MKTAIIILAAFGLSSCESLPLSASVESSGYSLHYSKATGIAVAIKATK